LPTVTNTLKTPDGTAIEGAAVTVELIASATALPAAGYVGGSDMVVAGVKATATSSAGVWSMTLTGQDDIAPANSYYRVVEQPPGSAPIVHTIQMPTAAGTYWLGDLLFDTATGAAVAWETVSVTVTANLTFHPFLGLGGLDPFGV